MNQEFIDFLQKLVDTSQIVIDRPKGSLHPRFPGKEYPVDYGYLEGTTSMDASGVDVWVGSLGKHTVIGMLCTVDLLKRDTELKILVDCSDEDIHLIHNFVNNRDMRATFIKF
jgi:inorganic pyrophosphatase